MKKKIFPVAAVALLLGSSCTKDFQSINTNPNAVTASQINYASLFTNAELITSGNSDGNAYEDWRGNLIYASCMIQHLSSTAGYWAGDKYTLQAGYLSAYWDNDFWGQPNANNPTQFTNSSPVLNIVEVVYNTKSDPANQNLYNMARIFKAFMFQRLTDMYGDLPYSQAGMAYISGIAYPKYDKQQDIYTDILNELSDAATKLDPSAATPGAADIVYGGDVAKWKKFAYSEMLRVAMRMSKVDPTNAQKWAAAAYQGGVFASNADNAILQHQAAAPNGAGSQVANGSGSVLGVIDPSNAHMSQTFVDFLKSTGDPRLPYLSTVLSNAFDPSDKGDTTTAVQIGQPNGYDNQSDATNIEFALNFPNKPAVGTADSLTVYQNRYSFVNRYTFAREDAPTFFLTYSETELLLAEAAYRGWISGASASDLYSAGVTAAMAQLTQAGVGPATDIIADYVTKHPLAGGKELQQINEQYWVASFLDETESWANWRRSNFPTLVPVVYFGNATNGTIPRRYTYPLTEAASNATNYAAAVAGLSDGDKMTSRVWWDAQ